jgi:hypothetical protein
LTLPSHRRLAEGCLGPGLTPNAFWKDVDPRCAAAMPDQFGGIRDWAVPHFRRGGAAAKVPPLEQLQPEEIGYHGPAGGVSERSTTTTR